MSDNILTIPKKEEPIAGEYMICPLQSPAAIPEQNALGTMSGIKFINPPCVKGRCPLWVPIEDDKPNEDGDCSFRVIAESLMDLDADRSEGDEWKDGDIDAEEENENGQS